jgi:biofilm PGA synthesis N-glycosyltransferase PgaC
MQLLVIITCISIAIYTVIMLFLITGLLRNRGGSSTLQPSVSVIVAARNEEQNIARCLHALVDQQYPQSKTEIIIVNDRSRDNTEKIVRSFQQKHGHIQLVNITTETPSKSPKKRALRQGIARSSGEIILTTDADCIPPPQWIARTVSAFDAATGVLVGLAPLQGHNFLGYLISLDSFANTLISAGGIGWNCGITGTGRNLAYRRKVYNEVGGFAKIAHSLSGDDDLFLQMVSRETGWKLKFNRDPATAVISPAAGNFSAYFRQHTRHVSASKYYTLSSKLLFLLYNLANVALFTLPVTALISREAGMLALAAFLLKLLLDLSALALVIIPLKRIRLLLLFPVWEIWYLLNQIILNPIGLIRKPHWK